MVRCIEVRSKCLIYCTPFVVQTTSIGLLVRVQFSELRYCQCKYTVDCQQIKSSQLLHVVITAIDIKQLEQLQNIARYIIRTFEPSHLQSQLKHNFRSRSSVNELIEATLVLTR
jgi:flavoprotein